MTAGQRPPSSPRGFSGFCLTPSERLKGSKVQGVQEVPIRPIRGKKMKHPQDRLLASLR